MSEDSQSYSKSGARFRLGIGLILVVLAVFCGGFISLPKAELGVRHLGYFFTLAISFFWLLYAIKGIGAAPWRTLIRGEAIPGLLAVLLGSWLLFVQADFGYKIAMDEYILASTARNLHESREVAVTELVYSNGNRMEPASTYVDKRPWMYPFIVSVLHDLIGYDRDNPFIVNGLLGVCLLGMSYRLGHLFAAWRGGLLSVLLWASLPLLCQNASGGGLELLNLCLIQFLLLLSAWYLSSPSACTEGMLSLTAVMLTYTRYESGLFLWATLLIILLGWWRQKAVILSWGSMIAAPLLTASLWQIRLYASDTDNWELTGDSQVAFGLDALSNNVAHALNFFFSTDDSLANSLLLSVAGGVGILIFIFLLRTETRRYRREKPVALASFIFCVFLLIQFLIVISFHAGRIDSPFVSRYALAFHLCLVLSILAAHEYIGARFKLIWRCSITVCLVYILAFTLPMNAKGIFSKKSFAVREQIWLESLSGSRIGESAFVIDRFTVPWALRDYIAVAPEKAIGQEAVLVDKVRHGAFDAIYYVERSHYDGETFVPDFGYGVRLRERFALSLVAERSFRPYTLTRVYRVKELLPQ